MGQPRGRDLASRRAARAHASVTSLVPVSTSGSSALAHDLLLAQEMAGRSRADSTRRSYQAHVDAYVRWCTERGLLPLPPDPAVVAVHLSWYAVRHDSSGAVLRGPDGTPVQSVHPSTVRIRLSAINFAARELGHPAPGEDARVARVMEGIARTFGVRPRAPKAALDRAALTAVVSAARQASVDEARVRVAVAAVRELGVRPGQLARMTWGDVDLAPDHAVLAVPPPTRARTRTPHRAEHTGDGACLVEALHQLRQATPAVDAQAPLLAHRGSAVSRQALHQLLDRHRRSGLDVEPPLRHMRDTALLLVGWFGALRRSNLVGLDWRDLTRTESGWKVLVRRSKTDQVGAGHVVWLPDATGSPICPAAALDVWRTTVARLLGADPLALGGRVPVFTPVDRHGNLAMAATGLPERLSGGAVNELVQRLTDRAGLTPARATWPAGVHPFGGHSLRAGFVTEALRWLTIPEVMEVTGHRTPEVLIRYNRQVRGASDNPARRMVTEWEQHQSPPACDGRPD